MIVDNSSYTVKDENGQELATVNGDSVNIDKKDQDRAFAQKSVNILPSGQRGKAGKNAVFTSASGNRTIESKSGALSFKAMDGSDILEVKTGASKSSFDVKEKEVEIPLKEGETFEVSMKGEQGDKDLKISGTGTGAGTGS